MIVGVKHIPQNCAPTRLNQIGCDSQTAPSAPRTATYRPALTRLAALVKLPLQNRVAPRRATRQSDWSDRPVRSWSNWKFAIHINALAALTVSGAGRVAGKNMFLIPSEVRM